MPLGSAFLFFAASRGYAIFVKNNLKYYDNIIKRLEKVCKVKITDLVSYLETDFKLLNKH